MWLSGLYSSSVLVLNKARQEHQNVWMEKSPRLKDSTTRGKMLIDIVVVRAAAAVDHNRVSPDRRPSVRFICHNLKVKASRNFPWLYVDKCFYHPIGRTLQNGGNVMWSPKPLYGRS